MFTSIINSLKSVAYSPVESAMAGSLMLQNGAARAVKALSPIPANGKVAFMAVGLGAYAGKAMSTYFPYYAATTLAQSVASPFPVCMQGVVRGMGYMAAPLVVPALSPFAALAVKASVAYAATVAFNHYMSEPKEA